MCVFLFFFFGKMLISTFHYVVVLILGLGKSRWMRGALARELVCWGKTNSFEDCVFNDVRFDENKLALYFDARHIFLPLPKTCVCGSSADRQVYSKCYRALLQRTNEQQNLKVRPTLVSRAKSIFQSVALGIMLSSSCFYIKHIRSGLCVFHESSWGILIAVVFILWPKIRSVIKQPSCIRWSYDNMVWGNVQISIAKWYFAKTYMGGSKAWGASYFDHANDLYRAVGCNDCWAFMLLRCSCLHGK